jgi:hypothetical protein
MNVLPENIIIFFSNILNAQTLSSFLAMWFYQILCVWETSVWTHLVLNFGCREFISWCGPGRVQVIGAWMSAIVVWLPSLCLCTSETELYFGWSSILCQCAFACGVHWGSCLSGIIDAQVTSMVTCEWEWGYETLLSFFCCMTELSPFPPMWRTHGDHLRVLILRELGKGIIVVSWLWGCQCNFGGWHASNVCNCAMLANQSLRAEAENGPNHFLLSAELMSCWLPQTPWAMRVSWEGVRVADIDKPENWVRVSKSHPFIFWSQYVLDKTRETWK